MAKTYKAHERISIGQILDAEPGSEQRKKYLQAWLKVAKDPELAALYFVGTTSGDARKQDKNLSEAEKAQIQKKIKNPKDFEAWRFLIDTFQQTKPKILLIKSEIKRLVGIMHGVCKLARAYQREAALLNRLLIDLDGEERASKLVSIFADFDLNEGIDVYIDKPIVTFNVKKGEGLFDTNLVEADCKVAYQCLNDAKKIVLHLMSMAKAIQKVVEETEQESTEHGYTLPDVVIGAIKETIAEIAEDQSEFEEYSFKAYKQLLADGKTEEAERRKENFIFPDYSEAEIYQKLYDVQKESFSVWSDNLE